MKILVPVKRVVDYNVKIRVDKETNTVDLDNVKMSINPFDEIAVEEAIRMKEAGKCDEIVIVSLGPEQSKETIRNALAMGADRGIHVKTEHSPEPLLVAKILAKIIEKDSFDLIILGKQSIDDDCNVSIVILPYEDLKEETEVDEEGLLYWFQFTFHKELIDIILSLKNKFEEIQANLKKLINNIKVEADEKKQQELQVEISRNEKELEALQKILSRVDTYRRNTFAFLRDKESIDKLITHIRIYKEQSE